MLPKCWSRKGCKLAEGGAAGLILGATSGGSAVGSGAGVPRGGAGVGRGCDLCPAWTRSEGAKTKMPTQRSRRRFFIVAVQGDRGGQTTKRDEPGSRHFTPELGYRPMRRWRPRPPPATLPLRDSRARKSLRGAFSRLSLTFRSFRPLLARSVFRPLNPSNLNRPGAKHPSRRPSPPAPPATLIPSDL